MALQMISNTNNHDSIYLSAPTTPTTLSLENLNFYSAPTSPIPDHAYKPTFDGHDQTGPATPKSCTYDYHDDYEDANNNFFEFEFETSRRYSPDEYDFDQMEKWFESPYQQNTKQEQQHQHKESLPAMAFADELFCDGKVMPLKPPPCLQNGNCNNASSCLSSPKSPTGALNFPFPRRSLWNDDFDPFMVALENVKGDIDIIEKRRSKEKDHRRARSMSPLRATSSQRPSKSMSFHHREINTQMEPHGPCSIWVPCKNRKMEKESKKNPIRLGESKGVLFARHARLVKMGQGKSSKQTQRGERGGKESEESCNRESKRQKIKKLLFKSVSMGRANNEEKQTEDEALPPKKRFTRKFSFMSSTGNGIAQCNHEEKRVSQVTKITLMQYRPKFSVCMGYGAKYVK